MLSITKLYNASENQKRKHSQTYANTHKNKNTYNTHVFAGRIYDIYTNYTSLFTDRVQVKPIACTQSTYIMDEPIWMHI
jgi:hypothetical protein